MISRILGRSFFLAIPLVSLLTASSLCGEVSKTETAQQRDQRMAWWRDARFGMFIHFGLYALPARHEWVRNYERITNEDYQKYFERFDPDLYQPREWAKMAKAAGMKYVVLTTKHHEGFCLFDSKYTDYKSTNTPCRRDLVKEYVEACRAEGLRVGFYYSLLDWHHPDYTIDKIHPLRPNCEEKQYTDAMFAKLNVGRDMAKYRQYMKDQVRELLTNYGKIDVLWFDYSFPEKFGKNRDDWDSKGLWELVRGLQPDIIINNRLDLPDSADFDTPEQTSAAELRKKFEGKHMDWETCQTFSGSWGYHRDQKTWKSVPELLTLLVTSVSNGGNLLLNVGPTGRGEFDYRAKDRLQGLADWMHFNSRSIYGCTRAPDEFSAPAGTLLTYNPQSKRLYLHVLKYPKDGKIVFGPADKLAYAQFLHDASEIRWTAGERNSRVLLLPVDKPPVAIPVVEIFLK
ncbi:MAG: alpha-L-fucosidase [Thermoguttaceae bacterium]